MGGKRFLQSAKFVNKVLICRIVKVKRFKMNNLKLNMKFWFYPRKHVDKAEPGVFWPTWTENTKTKGIY